MEFSVSPYGSIIVLSDFLTPYIAEGDKEPSWDGFVYIYTSKSKKKSDLKGRVAVQVKGKEVSDLSAKDITFPISVVDMNNYLYDGGVVYYVVYVNETSSKIYYITLTPVKLRKFLSEAIGKKTLNVTLTEFPSDNHKKATIMLNFFLDSKKQASFATSGMLSLEDLKNHKDVQQFSFSVSGYGLSEKDGQRAFLENEIYIYADMKGCMIPQPIDTIPENLRISVDVPCLVTIEGKTYYNGYTQIRTLDSRTIKIGDSLTITYNEKDRSAKFSYSPTPFLRKRARDLEFIINTFVMKSFQVGKIDFTIRPTSESEQQFNIEKQTELLCYLKKIIMVLDTLNIDQDINLEKLTEEELWKFRKLVVAFADKQPVPKLGKDLPAICYMSIQELKLMLTLEKCEGINTTYRIYDFFRSDVAVSYDNDKVTSQYSALDKEGYLSVSNIDYDAILPSYQSKLAENPRIFEIANNDMLTMLVAYDEGGQKNTKLLQVVKTFSEWISSEDTVVLPEEVKLLNSLQIIRRERELTIAETRQLLMIAEDSTMREDVLTGAYLLLDNQIAAELHFERMEPDIQEAFKRYPIYRFWNPTEEEIKWTS